MCDCQKCKCGAENEGWCCGCKYCCDHKQED